MATDLPKLVTPLPGPKAQAVIERDSRYISPSYTRGYPLVVATGQGAMVEDVDGNRFLDCSAGIAVVAAGHCHPRVVDAIQRQAARLIHMSGTDFYYENMVDLAQKLAAITPGGLPRKVYFGNSGTEAMEAAIKLANLDPHAPILSDRSRSVMSLLKHVSSQTPLGDWSALGISPSRASVSLEYVLR